MAGSAGYAGDVGQKLAETRAPLLYTASCAEIADGIHTCQH